MMILVAIAIAISGAISGFSLYIKSHPPDASIPGISSLRRGLQLGIMSSTSVSLLYIVMLFFPLVIPSRNLPFVLCAIGGNLLNLAAGIYCLRELTGESLFAGLLVLLNQLLWILYALRVLTVDF